MLTKPSIFSKKHHDVEEVCSMMSPEAIASSAPSNQTEEPLCSSCERHGADIEIQPCGCYLHARCLPAAILSRGTADEEKRCPACDSSLPICSIWLKPLSLSCLSRASSIRIEESSCGSDTRKAENVNDSVEVQREVPFLVLHNGQDDPNNILDEHRRGGRWTTAEVAYVDFLMEAFDNGLLPIEEGIKLHEFLAEILFCKYSRLTKKIKNASFNTRCYKLSQPPKLIDVKKLSSLEADFIASITPLAAQLEMGVNVSRFWRSHLLNLSHDNAKDSLLKADEWRVSLKAALNRYNQAMVAIRLARVRSIGRLLKRGPNALRQGSPMKKMKVDISASSSSVSLSSDSSILPSACKSSDDSVTASLTECTETESMSLCSPSQFKEDELSEEFTGELNAIDLDLTDDPVYTSILDDLATGFPNGMFIEMNRQLDFTIASLVRRFAPHTRVDVRQQNAKNTGKGIDPSLQATSLCMMLTKSPECRSDEENKLLGIIRMSYMSYVENNARGDYDIAMMLLTEWDSLESNGYGLNRTDGKVPKLTLEVHRVFVLDSVRKIPLGRPMKSPGFLRFVSH